ncbi:sensor domain-containing diguanylate cyclase [Grimontia hollisae]|nr:sensor domain-containing diguanylate cyclase [Grimontia hollisae]MDF2184094.1 sensor domain-containing diguanylate cyclase [Grimontia hollisae]STO56160.1 Probable diguanylate cyclase YcdT [Grimontia hollisae]STQ77027.1 Probable diguanylate cyclase YcdT [Grimontia hollisae]
MSMPNFKDILDIHPNPCVIHINFVPKYANNAFAKFSGMESAEDVLSLPSIRVLFEKEHWPEAQRRYNHAIETGIPTPPEVINHMDLKGNPMIAEITDKVIDWYGEKAMCTFVSVVTDQVRRERTLRDMAHRDDLTNLYNRRYLLDLFSERHAAHQRCQYLAIADIDHFKHINDTFGHPVGDIVLRRVAREIEGFTTPDEYAFRLGGEEFALLIWADNHGEAYARLEQLRKSLEHCEFRVSHPNSQPLTLSCTISIGMTVIAATDDFLSASLRADEALYIAKRSGRNNLINYEASIEKTQKINAS